jgi:hypothetical protein
MTTKIQKIISSLLVLIVTGFAFWSLLGIVNANEPVIYLRTAIWVWLCMWLFIAFLFDLHFKNPGALGRARLKYAGLAASAKKTLRVCGDAVLDRCEHLLRWKHYKKAVHYLLIPGFIFWASIIIFYVELSHVRIQYIFAGLSVVALTTAFYYIKEVFSRNKERVDSDIFVALSVVKIYTAAISFAATMAIMRSLCLEPKLFVLAIFCISFLLIYHALYQHALVNSKTISTTLIISAAMAVVAYYIYIFWNYNFVTAAIFFTAIYNLFWGAFHYHLDHALTKKIFLEIFLVCMLIIYMVLSNTNLSARILDGCDFMQGITGQ